MDDILPMYAMQMTGVFIAPLISISMALPVVIYIVARWRTYRDNQLDDPHLGLKVALLFFRNAAQQLCLIGGFLLIYGVLSTGESEMRSQIHRMAAGLIVPGLLIYGLHVGIMQRTNFRSMPAVSRMFDGINLIATGLIGFISTVMALFLLFQKDVPKEPIRIAWSMLLVYGPAWAIQGFLFGQRALGNEVPAATARFAGSGDVPRSGAPPAA